MRLNGNLRFFAAGLAEQFDSQRVEAFVISMDVISNVEEKNPS